MISNLQGRVALVTGCLGGIGNATCALLAEAGATVIGADLPADPGEWPEHHGDHIAYRPLDVTSETAWNTLADTIRRDHGVLDILVHNAGIAAIDKIEDTSLDQWKRVMAVNVEGPFLGTRALRGLLNETGASRPFGASIVMVSSIAGLVGAPFSACYSASKGAVRLFTKSAAIEFASLGYKVRVNSVHPGVVETGMIDAIRERYVESGIFASVEQAKKGTAVPGIRNATPDDIAKAVRFLASDEAGHMNGSEVVVDGGFTAR